MKKVALIGNYGVENRGDEMILEGIINKHQEYSFLVFSCHPRITEKKFPTIKSCYPFALGLRSFFRRTFLETLRNLKECDEVWIGGGGLFQDDDLFAPFLWGWQFFWVKFLKKSLKIYSTSVGPLKRKISRSIVRKVHMYAKEISVRDESSKKALEGLGVQKEKICIIPDPALFANIPQTKPKERIFYSFALRPTKYNKKLVIIIKKVFKELLKHPDSEILLISMQGKMDCDFYKEIIKDFNTPRLQTIHPKTNEEFLEQMQKSCISINLRLHASIGSFITNTPFIALSYSQKVQSFFNTLGFAELVLTPNEWSFSNIMQKIKYIQSNYSELQKAFSNKYKEVTSQEVQ